jgi:hypothetical protein
MLRTLAHFCLGAVGILATLQGLICCYCTFATNDYRPVLAAGFACWLVGSACLAGLWRWRRLPVAVLLVGWGLPSVAIWAELLRRGLWLFLARNG